MSPRIVTLFSAILALAFLIIGGCAEQSNAGWPLHVIDNTSKGADGIKLADVDGDGLMDIATGWEQGNISRLYFNSGTYESLWAYIEVTAPNVEDALPVDLDHDGFWDLVTCSEGNHMRISFHWGPRDKAAYRESEHWETTYVPETVGKTRWMFASPMNVDDKHGIDLIVGSKDPNGTLGWLESPADPREVGKWKLHEITPANWIMSIEIMDVNLDGREDILISDRNGPNRGVRWLENPMSTNSEVQKPWINHIIGMTDADPLFLGVLQSKENGFIQIWAPNESEYFMHYEQIDSTGQKWKSEKWAIPSIAGLIGKSAAIGDMDNDGKQDLVTTYDGAEDRSGVIWSTFDSVRNSWIHHDVSGPAGIKYDYASLHDMDQDGDLDILTCEEANNSQQGPGLGVIWYENPSIASGY
jgi:hypothetical protein